MSMPGIGEMLLIFLVVLLVFGAKRIPEIARGLGKGIREFKDATAEITGELSGEGHHKVQQPRPPRQGTPTPRAQSTPEPQEPVRADNPGAAEAKEKQAS